MKAATKKVVRAWLWPVTMTLYGVLEMVKAAGDITSMHWKEIGERGAKALPFVLIGLIMRKLFLTNPESLDSSSTQEENETDGRKEKP